MNNIFQENKKSFFILLGLLILLLIVVYFFFYLPTNQELKNKEHQSKSLENENQVLQIKISKSENDSLNSFDVDKYLLEKNLPLNPEIEALILTLQEIELVSGSKIGDINFTYNETVPERNSELEETDVIEDEVTGDENTDGVDENDGTNEESADFIAQRPENLQVMTVSLNVTTPDYEHFQTFVKEIEKQERMMMVRSMDFQNPAESELLFAEESTEWITAQLEITTFYYEE